jgi:hypothetical protein
MQDADDMQVDRCFNMEAVKEMCGARDQRRFGYPGIPREGIVVCPSAKSMPRRIDGRDGRCNLRRVRSSSEGAPIPGALERLRNAAYTMVFWTLRWSRCFDLNSRRAIIGALAVAAARAKVFPLTERAMAAIACTVQVAFGMEASKLIETNLLRRMLPAEDATTLPAVMTALKEAEWFLARGCRAY